MQFAAISGNKLRRLTHRGAEC